MWLIHVIIILSFILCITSLSSSFLVQGALDLFWLPIQQYQEDGRIVWGIQRGANSFVSSSGVAVVELSNRVLESVEVCYTHRGCML